MKSTTPLFKQASKQAKQAKQSKSESRALRYNFRSKIDSVCLWQVFRVVRENHSVTGFFSLSYSKKSTIQGESKNLLNIIKSGHQRKRVKFFSNEKKFVPRCPKYFQSLITKTISALSSFSKIKITLSYPQGFFLSILFQITHTLNKPHNLRRFL